MNILLLSMPDVAPVIIHEAAIHMPSLGIASVGGNVDDRHSVHVADLVRWRGNLRRHLTRALERLRPDLVGLSAMSWQYDTCVSIARLVREVLREIRPQAKIALGGYHATLMAEELAFSPGAALFDFLIRGEGEETFRRLANVVADGGSLADIPSLSWKNEEGRFVHNPRGGILDLASIRRPIRDRRRLTWGYHVLSEKIEVMETSRGCTRSCNFCSIRHMYGRAYRTYPIDRVIADLDDIHHRLKTRWVFLTDDNMVLDRRWVHEVCDAVIRRRYKDLVLVVQADCVSMAENEDMVKHMAEAGFKSVFLGIENVSRENLELAHKRHSVEISRKAVEICHKYGMMVTGGLVLGFPDDDEASLIRNFAFFKSMGIEAAWCQLLTPYPKTGIRETLIREGLVTNPFDYRRYNGMWANVRTRHLSEEELQRLFWRHKEEVLGWWEPSDLMRRHGRTWTNIWRYSFKPVLKYFHERHLRKVGVDGLFREHLSHLRSMNDFPDLDPPAGRRG